MQKQVDVVGFSFLIYFFLKALKLEISWEKLLPSLEQDETSE